MALAEATRVYLLYDVGGPDLFHERYVLASCTCGRGWHIVLTPDGDVYPEQISLENDDLSAYRIAVGDVLPHGLNAGNTYRIRNLPQGQALQQMLLDARHAAAVQAFPPGAGPGLAAPPNLPPAVGAARVADDGRVWVRIETCHDRLRGEIVVLSGNEILHGDVGLKEEDGVFYAIRRMPREEVASFKGKEASADARLLGVTFQGVSREERTWRDVSKEIVEEKFDDWALPGPRTATWCTRFLNRRGGGPVEHHRWWVSNHGLRADGWGVAEHEQLMKILDKLGRYDGLDLSNLAGAELAFRRLQLIEYYYSERGPGGGGKGGGKSEKKKDEDLMYRMEASVFTGSHKEFGDTMIAPSLMEFVSKEIETEASIMKQIRVGSRGASRGQQVTQLLPWRGIMEASLIHGRGGTAGRVLSSTLGGVRQRGIFPLPVPSIPDAPSAGSVSQSVRRRALQSAHVDAWVRDIIISLNSMYLGESDRGNFEASGSTTLSQQLCIERIKSAVLNVGKPPSELTGRGALDELQAKAGYTGEPAQLAPLQLDLLSLPPSGSSPSSFERILQGKAECFLKRLESKVLPDLEAGARLSASNLKAPYNDPIFRSKPRVYAAFCRKLFDAGLVEFRKGCKQQVGAFAVWKKSGKQRLVIDSRLANLHFTVPEKVALCTGSSFARLEVDPGPPVEVGGVDISDAFYQIELPASLRGFLG